MSAHTHSAPQHPPVGRRVQQRVLRACHVKVVAHAAGTQQLQRQLLRARAHAAGDKSDKRARRAARHHTQQPRNGGHHLGPVGSEKERVCAREGGGKQGGGSGAGCALPPRNGRALAIAEGRQAVRRVCG
eukprot:363694-Chlamydomonas_euryale.AAC.10